MTRGLAVAMLTLAGVVACSNADAARPAMVSVAVNATTPAPEATGVARGDTVLLMLERPMEPASIAMRFKLHLGHAAGPVVPGHLMFGDGYLEMMFVPDSLMRPGTRYFAELRDGVMIRGVPSSDRMGSTMLGGARMTMTGGLPQGAMRMEGGMGWRFTTGN